MKKVINYKVEKKEWEEAQNKEFNKINKKVKIDGFRPGKAPKEMVLKKYGADILIDAANALIDKEYKRLIIEEKLMPVVDPKIELVKSSKDELEVNFTFILEPEVTLGEYKNLGIKKEKVKVSKDEIDNKINSVLNDYAELVIKDDSKAVKGDIAIIDFEGFIDGVAFEGGKGENYSLELGSNTFIPGFEDAIIGMKKGEEKDIKVTFPKDYGLDDLNGKDAIFKVKVNELKVRELPVLDKDFFDDLGLDDITNEEEYRKMIEDEIKEEKENKANSEYVNKLLEKATSNMKCDIDDEIVEAEANSMYNTMIKNMKSQGLSEEIYLKYANTTKEDIIKNIKEKEALVRLKNSYLLDAIIKEEKIDITEEEVNKEIENIKGEYDVTKEEILDEFGGIEALKYNLKIKKAIEILKGE